MTIQPGAMPGGMGMRPGGLTLPGGMMLPEAGLLRPFPVPDWAQQAQGQDPSHAGIVDYERAMKMTSDDIIACVIAARNGSATARRPLENRWRYHEALYHLRTDDPEKEQWQAQIAVPEVYNKIEVWLSQIQSALLDNPQWFKVINEGGMLDDPVIRLLQKWTKLVVERSDMVNSLLAMWREAAMLGSGCMRAALDPFIDSRPHVEQQPIYSDPQQAFQAAMAGMPTMQPVISVNPQPRDRFRWKQRTIWCIYPDPEAERFYDGRYCDEVDLVYEEDLEEAVKAGFYDSIDDIGEPVTTKHLTGLDPWRLGISDSNQVNRRRHLRDNYEGDIWDRDGHLVAKNWKVTLINERAIVQMAPNPIFRSAETSGRSWIWSTPNPYPNRVWGRSLIDATAKVQHELTDLVNLGLDDAKYVALGAFRWDSSLTGEPQVPDTVAPGQVFEGKQGLIERLVFPSAFNTTLPLKNWLDEITGKETQISEWADGRPSSRGRPSARQVMAQTAAGQAQMSTTVRGIERDDLEPALNLLVQFIVQFGDDFDDPRLQALIEDFGGPPMMSDPMFRFQLLDRPYRIKVNGISMLLDRESLLDRVMQLAGLAQQIGLPPPNQFDIYYTAMTTLGIDPEWIGLPPTPEAYMQSLMMPQVGGPGANGMAGGQAPAAPPVSRPGGSQAPPSAQIMNSSAGGPTGQGMG